jgi:hypothetical protein
MFLSDASGILNPSVYINKARVSETGFQAFFPNILTIFLDSHFYYSTIIYFTIFI